MDKLSIKKVKNASIEVKASAAYTLCNILQRSLSFITLPLFTRLLTTEQYGQVTVYNSWQSFLNLFITLYLAYGSFTTAMAKFENERGKYIAAINGLCTILAIFFLVIYYPFRKIFNTVFELPTYLIFLLVISLVCENALQCWYGKERFEYGYKRVVAVTLGMSILMPLLSYILVVHSQEKGYARIIGTALITIFAGLICYVYFILKEKTFFNKKYWKYALGFNIPLIPYYLSQTVFNQSDRIMISHLCGQDKAAIYSVAYTLAIMLNVVLNAINNSYTPWFYARLKDGDRNQNRSVSSGIAVLIAVLLLGVIAVAPEVIYVLASEEYVEAIWVVPPVAMSLLFLFYTQLFVNFEFYYEEKGMLVSGTIISAILNIVLNVLLIPIFGFVAAGYTTLFSYIVFVLMHYRMYKKLIRKYDIEDDMFDYKTLIIIAVSFMAIAFVLMSLYDLWVIRYSVIFIALIVLFFNRNKLLEFGKKLK